MRNWYKLADRLGLPVEVTMRQTSSTQYLQWLEYLRTEPNDFHRNDAYFNQILAALYHLLYKNTGKASPYSSSDFQIKFTPQVKAHKEEPIKVSKMAASKAVWLSAMGKNVDMEKNPVPASVCVLLDEILEK
jgi:hypothetical protein